MNFIIYLVFCFFVFLVAILCYVVPIYYIEKQKYITFQHFLDSYDELTDDELFGFIDHLHFKDREKALSSMYKTLYKDLCKEVRMNKK